ncbi:hypothetical protein ACFSSC_11655, partial [Corynebacterium mendelii]|uniref:hypothetical protein n=1 Tax=Corynebacterium mendelii TaxID=2765362 RepID=UPI003634423A
TLDNPDNGPPRVLVPISGSWPTSVSSSAGTAVQALFLSGAMFNAARFCAGWEDKGYRRLSSLAVTIPGDILPVGSRLTT